jgi:hypothetical protein
MGQTERITQDAYRYVAALAAGSITVAGVEDNGA